MSTEKKLADVEILTDNEENDPILNCTDYADTIIRIVKRSTPNFSIGVYGEWGSGKSTLMKLIETKIKNQIEDTVNWDDLDKKGSESHEKFSSYLSKYYDLGLVKKQSFSKRNKDNISPSNTNFNFNTIVISTFSKIRQYFPSWLSIELEKTGANLMIGNIVKDRFNRINENEKIKIELKQKEILTVWFNAWRYEREERYALIALMKTIAYAMGDLPHYQPIKRILLRGVGIITKNVMRSLATRYLISEKGWEELENKLLPKMELLSKVDRNTIYFDGILKIKQEMDKISKENKNIRIVVFIDDLDRCSPTTTLEVFESIKVFLGMEGFVYIIGISHTAISKLINVIYEKFDIKGEDYIRKVIQVVLTLPEWNAKQIDNDLIPYLSDRLCDPYKEIVRENAPLFPKSVKVNPREVKRFINEFVIAHNTLYNNDDFDKEKSKEVLAIHAVRREWKEFYALLSDKKFRTEMGSYAKNKRMNDYINKINERKNDEDSLTIYENVVYNFREKKDLWDFLEDNSETIFNIEDWSVPKGRLESTKIDAIETENQMKEYILKGNQHYYNKDYRDSLYWYNKATDLDRNNFDEWNKKGYAFIKIGKPKEAIECYTHYLEKHPKNPVALNNIAYELVKIHKSEDALHFVEKSLEIDNDNAYALDTKGVILGELKRYDEAIEYLEKALEKDPKNYIRWNHKGEVYLKQKKYKEAISCFETSLKLKPHYIKAEKNKNDAQKNLEAQ